MNKDLVLNYAITAVAALLIGIAILYKIQTIHEERTTQPTPLMDFIFR